MQQIKRIIDEECDMMLGEYLRRRMKLSATLIKKQKYGNIYVNGIASTVRARVKRGDEITVNLCEKSSEGIVPMDIPLKILYEDEHILAVDKPTNMPIHPSRANNLPTLANAVAHYLNGGVFRAVGRLDRDTSGIVVMAKDKYTSAIMAQDMKDGKFKKKYIALLSAIPAEECGVIDAPIERECEGAMKRVVRENGKRAISEYRVISRNDGKAVVQINLITGRTHQIRVHMAHIGCPLYADFLYGERVEGESYRLKCIQLTFPHPITRECIEINAPYDVCIM